jgi:hypothetical protein
MLNPLIGILSFYQQIASDYHRDRMAHAISSDGRTLRLQLRGKFAQLSNWSVDKITNRLTHSVSDYPLNRLLQREIALSR